MSPCNTYGKPLREIALSPLQRRRALKPGSRRAARRQRSTWLNLQGRRLSLELSPFSSNNGRAAVLTGWASYDSKPSSPATTCVHTTHHRPGGPVSHWDSKYTKAKLSLAGWHLGNESRGARLLTSHTSPTEGAGCLSPTGLELRVILWTTAVGPNHPWRSPSAGDIPISLHTLHTIYRL